MVSGAASSEAMDLNAFSAEDDFDLVGSSEIQSSRQSALIINPPVGGNPCPSGGLAPPGYEVTCVEGNEERPTLCVRHPSQLTTSEEGHSDLFELYSGPPVSEVDTYEIRSPDISEATVDIDHVTIDADSCARRPVWVRGVDDGNPDGARNFEIQIRDGNNQFLVSIPGVNNDDDSFTDVTVHVEGTKFMRFGETGQYDVIVQNLTTSASPASNLFVETTLGLEITNFAASVIGGDPLDGTVTFEDGVLSVENFSLESDEVLLVTLEALMHSSNYLGEKVMARVTETGGSATSDDERSVHGYMPRF
jgi:hypothetical protein